MKIYEIWLDGGNTIGDTISDENADKLLQAFRQGYRKVEFEDINGTVLVDMDKVSAIAISNIKGKKT